MRVGLMGCALAMAMLVGVAMVSAEPPPNSKGVVINSCAFNVRPLKEARIIGAATFDRCLVVTLKGENFRIRALDPVVKLGTRRADDFRIFPDEKGMEAEFFGAKALAGASAVSVAYPDTAPAVFPVSVPAAALKDVEPR